MATRVVNFDRVKAASFAYSGNAQGREKGAIPD
jgi:hypothetical protein